METTEKVFRYSYTFKNLGVFYLMFLFSCIVAGLVMGQQDVLFFILPIMLGFGAVLLLPYLISRVSISDLGIKTKALLGTKSLQWSEIGRFSTRGSSTRLHHYDGNTVLSIDPRLDGYIEIFELLHQKRPDLFDIDRYKSFSHNMFNAVASLVLGVFLVVLGLLVLLLGKNGSILTLILGFSWSMLGFINWYSSPRVLTLGQKSLDVGHLRKVISYPVNDIVDITLGEKQHPIKSVFVILRNRDILPLSGFDQTPIVMYYVLKRWRQLYAAGQPGASA